MKAVHVSLVGAPAIVVPLYLSEDQVDRARQAEGVDLAKEVDREGCTTREAQAAIEHLAIHSNRHFTLRRELKLTFDETAVFEGVAVENDDLISKSSAVDGNQEVVR